MNESHSEEVKIEIWVDRGKLDEVDWIQCGSHMLSAGEFALFFALEKILQVLKCYAEYMGGSRVSGGLRMVLTIECFLHMTLIRLAEYSDLTAVVAFIVTKVSTLNIFVCSEASFCIQ